MSQQQGTNITGVSGASHGQQQNAEAMQRAAQKAGQIGGAFQSNAAGGQGAAGQNNAQLSGSNITGVSGATHGQQQNAQAMQQAAQSAGQLGGQLTSQAGAQLTNQVGTQSGTTQNNAQLSGSNITGVSGASHGQQQNAQAMQRAAQKAPQQ